MAFALPTFFEGIFDVPAFPTSTMDLGNASVHQQQGEDIAGDLVQLFGEVGLLYLYRRNLTHVIFLFRLWTAALRWRLFLAWCMR